MNRPMPMPFAIRADLGTRSDYDVARHYGISISTISRWRVELRIPAYALHTTTRRYLTLLGAHPDGLRTAQMADVLGVTRQAVHQVLRKLRDRGLVTSQQLIPHRAHLHPPLLWRLADRRETHAS